MAAQPLTAAAGRDVNERTDQDLGPVAMEQLHVIANRSP